MKEELIMKLAEDITMVMILSIIGGLLIGWYATYVYFKSHKVSTEPPDKYIVRETMKRNEIEFNAEKMRDVANEYIEREDWVQIIQKDIIAEASHGIYEIRLDEKDYIELADSYRKENLIQYLRVKGFHVTDLKPFLIVRWEKPY